MKKITLLSFAILSIRWIDAQNLKFYSGKIETRTGEIINVQKLGKTEHIGRQKPIIFTGKLNGQLIVIENLAEIKIIDLRECNSRGNRVTVIKKNGQKFILEDAFIRMHGDDIYSRGLYYTSLNPITDNYECELIVEN